MKNLTSRSWTAHSLSRYLAFPDSTAMVKWIPCQYWWWGERVVQALRDQTPWRGPGHQKKC